MWCWLDAAPETLPCTCRDVQSSDGFHNLLDRPQHQSRLATSRGRRRRGSPQDHPAANAHEQSLTRDHRRRFLAVSTSILSPAASQQGSVLGAYSRSLKNPALQLLQMSSKSASTTPQRPIWNTLGTVAVRDFWENGCIAQLVHCCFPWSNHCQTRFAKALSAALDTATILSPCAPFSIALRYTIEAQPCSEWEPPSAKLGDPRLSQHEDLTRRRSRRLAWPSARWRARHGHRPDPSMRLCPIGERRGKGNGAKLATHRQRRRGGA